MDKHRYALIEFRVDSGKKMQAIITIQINNYKLRVILGKRKGYHKGI